MNPANQKTRSSDFIFYTILVICGIAGVSAFILWSYIEELLFTLTDKGFWGDALVTERSVIIACLTYFLCFLFALYVFRKDIKRMETLNKIGLALIFIGSLLFSLFLVVFLSLLISASYTFRDHVTNLSGKQIQSINFHYKDHDQNDRIVKITDSVELEQIMNIFSRARVYTPSHDTQIHEGEMAVAFQDGSSRTMKWYIPTKSKDSMILHVDEDPFRAGTYVSISDKKLLSFIETICKDIIRYH